jgi:hypothetical protein
MSQPNRHDRRRKALSETRSRRDSRAAVSPSFIGDITMTLSEWRSNRDGEFVAFVAD